MMRNFRRFIEQIEKARQRLPATGRGKQAAADNAPAIPDPVGLLFPEVARDTPEASSLYFTAGARHSEFARPAGGRAVNPKQVDRYLREHNLDVTELINDRLLRERVLKGDDTLDINYLDKGVTASKSVCRVNICTGEGEEGYGTGFLIAPQILITNNHVLPDRQYAEYSYAEFNYEKGADDLPKPVKVFRFNPSTLFYTNEDLDYTIVWVEERSSDNSSSLLDFGYLKLNPNLGKTKEGNYVSVIQHPDGKMKKVALRENEVTNLSLPKFIRYVTDTKSGSSGAPVFNDKWEVVAVHHAGIPRYNERGQILNRTGDVWDRSQGEVQVDWLENEGVRVSSIVFDISTCAAPAFPMLCEYFKPLTDIQAVSKSMGIKTAELENELYYPEDKDAADKEQYYSALANPQRASFDELHNLLETSHSSHRNYSPSKYLYPRVDLHPDGLLRSVYSGKEFTVQELILSDQRIDIERQLRFIEMTKEEGMMATETFNEHVDALEEVLPYNCEHVVCQSWFNKQEPMRGDLHHLFTCEADCNSFRGNHPYYDFPDYQSRSSALLEKEKAACGNLDGNRFEPENNKGIVARAVMYFLVRYPGAIEVYTSADIEMLRTWAEEQPVTLYEKHRNREIWLSQGNRNPFIDFSDLPKNLNFNLTDMTKTKKVATPFEEAEEGAAPGAAGLSLADMVKLSVLKSAGRTNGPDDLGEGTSLGSLISRPEQFALLRAYLVNVVAHFKPGSTITVSQIENCSTVGELIQLVRSITN